MSLQIRLFFSRIPSTFTDLHVNKSIFRGSSAVEQLAVNELVAGSIPAHGALNKTPLFLREVFYLTALWVR